MEDLGKLVREAVRDEMRLGLQPPHRIALDVEGGSTEDGRRYCWGVYDHDRACFVPEMNRAIAGYIQGLGVRTGAYKGKPTYKLKLLISCGHAGEYAIGAGLKTTFAKGMLNAIASLGPAQARGVIKISCTPGNDQSVVLPSVYTAGPSGFKWLRPAFDQPKDMDEIRLLYKAAVSVVPEVLLNREAQGEAA